MSLCVYIYVYIYIYIYNGGRCVWLKTYHPCSVETSRKSGVLIYPEPLGPPRPVAGHLYLHIHRYTHTYVRIMNDHSGLSVTQHRKQSAEYSVQSKEYRVLSTKYRVKRTEYGVRSTSTE